MRYNIVKDAKKILDESPYIIKNPEKYLGKWSSIFKNNNPICLELGMGRGSFIIQMAKKNPNVKKELGFVDQLFSKNAKVISNTISNLESAAEEIASIADKGRNPLSYEINENRLRKIV